MAKIISKSNIKQTSVFDITMPKIHNFVANGIVVHNCDSSTREFLTGKDGQSGYLFGKYGDKVAQVSTQQMLRLKSSIKDVNRYFNDGKVLPEIEEITKALPNPPQGVNDYAFVHGFTDTDGNNILGIIDTDETLKKYVKQYPEEWAIVEKCLGIVRGVSKHASAFLISNTPIADVVPMTDEGATQYDAKGCEAAKLIKYDFLIVNNLKDIQDCIKRINKKNNIDLPTGFFIHEGKKLFIWDLPEDSKVYASIENGNTETLFQISTNVMRPLVEKIKPKNILDGAVILALGRPGPLDYIDPKTGRNMAEEYIERRNGGGSAGVPIMNKLLPDTYGIQVYQEDTSKVAREIGKMTAIEAETLRRHFSKKNKTKAMEMKPIFMKGAVETVDKETAEIIWSQMETSSRYSFNKSHSVGYFYITYACMFLKYYYPLEWWASILSNASEEEISGELMKHVRDMVSPPDIRLSESDEMTIDYENKKILSKLTVLKGLGKATADKIINARPYSSLQEFSDKKACSLGVAQKLISVGLFDSFYPNPNINNILKINAYTQCVAETEYQEKIKAGKKPKERGDKELHTMFQENMGPVQRYLLKKKIFPSMPLNLSEIMRNYSSLKQVGAKKTEKVCFDNSFQKSIKFITGDEIFMGDHWSRYDTVEFCFAAFVKSAKEFSWKDKKTGFEKKRLALQLECDGRDIDTVMWQDRYTNKLEYPKELKEGCIAIFFCTKYQDRPFYPYEIVIEKLSIAEK